MSNNKILLESGTNELEIIVFSVNDNSYGINVAKVREIIDMVGFISVPLSNPSMEGLFLQRGKVIPLINLKKYLNMKNTDDESQDKVIVTEFNKMVVGFHVSNVSRIHRISWENIEAPSSLTNTETDIITGIVKLEDRIVLLLDFEKIVYDIAPSTAMKLDENIKSSIQNTSFRSANQVLIAEDSEMLMRLLTDLLNASGYTNQLHYKNGKDAWDYLEKTKKKPDIVITDIEMPAMDGHHLTKRIKDDESSKHIPVIIFSSLINDSMYAKGLSVGADEQVSKPEIDKLVSMLDKHILKK